MAFLYSGALDYGAFVKVKGGTCLWCMMSLPGIEQSRRRMHAERKWKQNSQRMTLYDLYHVGTCLDGAAARRVGPLLPLSPGQGPHFYFRAVLRDRQERASATLPSLERLDVAAAGAGK